MRNVKHGADMHGALMPASVLNTPRAMEMSLYVVRAFVRLREGAVLAGATRWKLMRTRPLIYPLGDRVIV